MHPGSSTLHARKRLAYRWLGIAVLVMAVIPWMVVEPWVFHSTAVLLFVTVSATALALFTPLHRWILQILPERGIWGWLHSVASALIRGSSVMRSPRAFVAASAWTLISWGMEIGVYVAAGCAIGMGLGVGAWVVVTFLLTFALLIPSAPGQVGTHQALSLLLLAPFGIGEANAVAASILVQAIALSTLGAWAGWAWMSESRSS